jgi:hypothetical protein
MVAFAALRPIGIARDDLAYLDIYNNVCPTLTCGQWVQGTRDWGWYSLVGLFKSVLPTPRVMLGIAAFALFIKLWVIFRLSKGRLVALMLFAGMFYQAQDLTAFRVSLSLAAFMLSIYLLSKRLVLVGSLSTFLTGFFHQQAFLAPLILLAGILKRRYSVFVLLAILPICLLFSGFTFQAYMEVSAYQDWPLIDTAIKQGLSSYISMGQSGAYENVRIMPYSYLPLIVLMVCFSKYVFTTNNDLYRYCAMSFVVTCWLTWACAWWQEPQARFFEFFALPAVLMIGNFRNSLMTNLAAIVVSAVFVVRYNVLHPLLTG